MIITVLSLEHDVSVLLDSVGPQGKCFHPPLLSVEAEKNLKISQSN